MIAQQFEYVVPASLGEAVNLLQKHGGRAKILAGGHSLIPAMKLRLAQPPLLIDLGRIKDLSYIREEGGQIRDDIGEAHKRGSTLSVSPYLRAGFRNGVRNEATSSVVSGRLSPTRKYGSEIGPMATRLSLTTEWPIVSNIFRIC